MVAAVREYWNKSGIPRISDCAIINKALSLYNEWHGLNKNKMKTSSVDMEKRKKFEEKLDKLFDIASPDAIKILESDRLRSLDARQADIDFYLDQKGARIGFIGGLDKVHQKARRKGLRSLNCSKRKLPPLHNLIKRSFHYQKWEILRMILMILILFLQCKKPRSHIQSISLFPETSPKQLH